MTDKIENPWHVPVVADEIPQQGLHRDIEAPAEVRAEIARLAGLRELPRLSAAFDLARRGAGVRVSGTVTARVGQTCVVTLEPLESTLEEPVDLLFMPQRAGGGSEPDSHAQAEEEPPEPLRDGRLDLGAIATEFLILGVDPYPRKPGVQFAAPPSDAGGGHPFAALAALKKRPGGGQS